MAPETTTRVWDGPSSSRRSTSSQLLLRDDCPSFPEDYHINYFMTAIWLRANHHKNWVMTQIHNSSQFVLSGDCTGETLYRKPFGTRDFTTDDCDKDDAVAPALTFALDSGGGLSMHYGGNNALFADGHVDWVKKFDVTRMTFSPTDMQSWDDLKPDKSQ